MFAHITLAVRDAQRTARFFAATMLWQPIHMPGNIDLDAAWLEIAHGQQLHILTVPGYEPSPFEREYGRHVAFFASGREFPALKKRLLENGATLVDPIRPTPFERFFFVDPDGYYFEILDCDDYVRET